MCDDGAKAQLYLLTSLKLYGVIEVVEENGVDSRASVKIIKNFSA